MRVYSRAIAAAVLAISVACTPSFALASDQEVRQLKSKDDADLASGKAYIVYKTLENKFDVLFLRSMTEAELVQFSENRAVALAERRAKLRERRDGAPGVSDEELLPDASFAYVDPSIRNLVRLDSGRVFEKAGKERTYVVEVPPGEYTIFGAGIDGFTSGTCMCMGSVRFEAASGQITVLGSVLVALEDGKSAIPELADLKAPEYIKRKTPNYIMSVRPASLDENVPQKFEGLPVVAADFRAADKFPNFLGMVINRMPPIPGVLRYERDTVIDVKAELAAEQAAKEEAEAEAEAMAKTAAGQTEAKAVAETAEAAAVIAEDEAALDPPVSADEEAGLD